LHSYFFMIHILHIDTSANIGLVMISRDGEPLVLKYNETERDHAGTINYMVEAVLTEAGLSLTDLAAVAVCSGPGSYTGLRIGMATAKGYCYALGIPIILHNKLELLVKQDVILSKIKYMSILPARKDEYFVLINNIADFPVEPLHKTVEEINEIIAAHKNLNIFGKVEPDIILYNELLYSAIDSVIPELWAILAKNNLEENRFENIATIEPLYVKSVFIQKKK